MLLRGRCEARPCMSMPFYVSPEQLMKDRADFARKGIARGRSVVAVQYADGILFVSENPSQALHKVSEIYDRQVADGHGFAVMGGQTESVVSSLESSYVEAAPLADALKAAVVALGHG